MVNFIAKDLDLDRRWIMSVLNILFGSFKTSNPSRLLVNELREAIRSGNKNRENELCNLIVQKGSAISTALAEAALGFDPDHLDKDHPNEKFYLARTALGLISEIGKLDKQSAKSLFERFVRGRDGSKVINQENWGGVFSTAIDTLQKLGYKVVEPRN
jgi:hypothetical protein